MEVFDVFFEKLSDITQEPIQQCLKKLFHVSKGISWWKNTCFWKKLLSFFYQAPSEFFFAVMTKNFSQDCQNCILRVQIDILRFFD